MLLSIDSIREELDQELLPLGPDMDRMRLIPGGLTPGQLHELEQRLNVTFPSDFKELVCAYDFGDLTIGPVVFGGPGDFASELIEQNETMDEWGSEWWGRGIRPKGRVMIAGSDPYTIVLDTMNGSVLAFVHGEGWEGARGVAANFTLFVRGLGTAMRRRLFVTDKATLARQISDAVDAESYEFWRQFVF